MRFILGLIVGVALTIGGAWVHDGGSVPPPPAPPADATAPMPPAPLRTNIVNWDVLEAFAQEQVAAVKGLFDRVVGG